MSANVTSTNPVVQAITGGSVPPLAVAMLFCASLLFPGIVQPASAQDSSTTAAALTDKARGIELYRKNNLDGAIKALTAAVKEDRTDAEAWHILGLAYYNSGDGKNARKAFEAEALLRPDSSGAHTGVGYSLLLEHKFTEAALAAERALALNAQNPDAHYIIGVKYFREGAQTRALEEARQAIALNPNLAPAYLLKIQTLLGTSEWALVYLPNESEEQSLARFKEAQESLAAYLKLYPSTPNRDLLHEMLENLNSILKPASNAAPKSAAERTVFTPQEVTRKARILKRVEPQYTMAASGAGVSGVVVIRAIIAPDGRLRNIRVIRGLPNGLTEEAIKAARETTFQPAIKDGRLVSQHIQIEYNFMH
jgi:TonB family protein